MNELLTLAGVCIGALIAGLFTLISNRYNFERDLKKESLKLKQQRLDEVVKYAIEYFSAGGLLVSAIDGVSKDVEYNGKAHPDASEFLKGHDKKYTDASHNLEFCNAKLIIYDKKSSDALLMLWQYHNYLSEIRISVFRHGSITVPDQVQMRQHLKELGSKRTQFFNRLEP